MLFPIFRGMFLSAPVLKVISFRHHWWKLHFISVFSSSGKRELFPLYQPLPITIYKTSARLFSKNKTIDEKELEEQERKSFREKTILIERTSKKKHHTQMAWILNENRYDEGGENELIVYV